MNGQMDGPKRGLIDAEKLENHFERIAGFARRDGAEAELLVESGERLQLSVNEGRIEKFDSSQASVGGVRVIFNGVEGYCWTESLDPADLETAYAEALENAKFAARGRSLDQLKNESVELYEAAGAIVNEDPTLFNDSIHHVSMDDKIERAKELERLTKVADPRIASVPYNSYGEASTEMFIFNTRGVRARQRRTSVSGYAYCLAKQGEESRMAGESFFTRDSKTAEAALKDVSQTAARKALLKLGASSPETGRYPVIIDRDVVAEVFGLIVGYFSAKSVAEKTSIFGDHLGRAIASPLLNVTDEPHVVDGVGNRAFDAEGAPTKRTELIHDGVLGAFLTNSVYARKLGIPHTASASRSAKGELDIGPSNLVIAPGTTPFKKLLNAYPKLIYITDFTGYHAGFREGSGEFGFQSEGELWENGERVRALCNFVVAGSIPELLLNVEQISDRTTKRVSSVVAPDLLIRSLSVAGA